MKADISLAERRRIEREQWAEIRAVLAPRHFATMQEQMAMLARLEHEVFIEAASAIYAIMGRRAVPAPAPVVTPDPEPVAPAPPVPELPAARPVAPDGLRQRFGLR